MDLDEQNVKTRQQVDREMQNKLDVQGKLQLKVAEFNSLVHEQRFAEAEVVAKQIQELDPKNPLAAQVMLQAKFIRRYAQNMEIKDKKERGFVNAMLAVDEASIPLDDQTPYVHGDAKQWKALTERRAKYLKDRDRRHSEREMEILQKLETPVSVSFLNQPLGKVLDHLGQLAQVNIYLDPQGLAEEGINSDTQVSLDLRSDVKLKSALNLILHPLRLNYVVKDEVLKITSQQLRNGETFTKTYNVADLIIPIPNFAPNRGLGLDGAYGDAMGRVNMGGGGAPFGGGIAAPVAVVASRDGKGSHGAIDPNVLAQMSRTGRGGTNTTTSGLNGLGSNSGPGAGSAGSGADFDSLINLIVSTIQPQSWDEVADPVRSPASRPT